MLIEIPDGQIIIGVIALFGVGLGLFFVAQRLGSLLKRGRPGVPQDARLEYYEKQLIDMKIRLDVLELQEGEQKTDPNVELKQFLEGLMSGVQKTNEAPKVKTERVFVHNVASVEISNPINHVLSLVTDKDVTSRDIQVTLKKSREHTSRLMKRLFEDGYVTRNTDSKPYTYSITEKGRTKIGQMPPTPQIA